MRPLGRMFPGRGCECTRWTATPVETVCVELSVQRRGCPTMGPIRGWVVVSPYAMVFQHVSRCGADAFFGYG